MKGIQWKLLIMFAGLRRNQAVALQTISSRSTVGTKIAFSSHRLFHNLPDLMIANNNPRFEGSTFYSENPRRTIVSASRLFGVSSDSENDSQKERSFEQTWTYTPYVPPATKGKKSSGSRRRFSSSSNWKTPKSLKIPLDSVDITFSRSSGAGGQNVNKVNTRASITFHLPSATWIPAEVQERIKESDKHKNRINKEGMFSLSSQEHRTQAMNRATVIKKVEEIVLECWPRPKVRKMRKGISKNQKEKNILFNKNNVCF